MSDTMSVNDMLARLRADAADERFDGARLGPTAVRELLRHVDELAVRLADLEARAAAAAAEMTAWTERDAQRDWSRVADMPLFSVPATGDGA